MKLCFICNEYPPSLHGGIGTTTRILATELAKKGHQVRVVGVYPAENSQPHFQDDDGVQVFRLEVPKGRFGWISARIEIFKTIRRWARSGELDLIEVPDYEGYAAGWLSLPVPVVTRVVGAGSYNRLEGGLPPIRKYFWIERASYKRSDFFCAMSAYAARRAETIFGFRKDSILPIYNPIEIPRVDGNVHRSRNRVLFTGTLVYRKGIISLVKAWSFVLQKFPSAELHIYGKDGRAPNGTSMTGYLQGILPREAGNSVHFHGHIDRHDLWQELATARVAVFPSYSETFGNAPVEAMAAGCPTIYTRRSCGPEIIEDGVDGLLVEPDDITEISDTVLRVLEQDALASRLGEAARETVRNRFAVDLIVSRNESFYSRCIEHFHRGYGRRITTDGS